jgi:hypothetical protein
MKAYDKGFLDGKSGKRQPTGRVFETDKVNDAYFHGYANGVKARFPNQPIVKCNRDSAIFPAFEQNEHIVCPTCARIYIKEGDKYVSDRELTILIK